MEDFYLTLSELLFFYLDSTHFHIIKQYFQIFSMFEVLMDINIYKYFYINLQTTMQIVLYYLGFKYLIFYVDNFSFTRIWIEKH